MKNLDLQVVDFCLHHFLIYRKWRSLKPQHFKAWKARYLFEIAFGAESKIPFDQPDGVKIMLEKNNQLSFAIHQGFEQDELDFVRHYLTPGMGFLDIGANIGLFSLTAAKILAGSAPCLAVEPASSTRLRLEENIQLNNQGPYIQILPWAFSDAHGELPLKLAQEGFDAFHSFAHPFMGGQDGVEMVSTQTLDQWKNQNTDLAEKIRLIKIDVEGWEANVLKGGRNWLSQDNAPVLLVEFTEANAQQAGYSCIHLSNLLSELGYRLFRYHPKSKSIKPEPPQQTYDYQNLLAIKNENQVLAQLNRTK